MGYSLSCTFTIILGFSRALLSGRAPGYSLASAADEEPDAPTLEAEALQDYPPLVAFHEGCKLYRQGKITLAQLDELKDRAFKEVRETFCRTVKGDE
ncbi:hypothetical protein [uncultured Bilophila sp.]|uniref:hypothetical protein n=1 Tax=uncultured Bilophila sp. TaxID=529385 RepID=UPI00280C17A4|nr:hypothetical protein [uncultured Bilophila sp.]